MKLLEWLWTAASKLCVCTQPLQSCTFEWHCQTRHEGSTTQSDWLNWVMLDDTRGGCSGLAIFDICPSIKEKDFLADTLPSIFKMWREFLLLFNWDEGGSLFSLDLTSKQMISVAENKEPCLGLFWSYPLSKINSHGSVPLHSRSQCMSLPLWVYSENKKCWASVCREQLPILRRFRYQHPLSKLSFWPHTAKAELQ